MIDLLSKILSARRLFQDVLSLLNLNGISATKICSVTISLYLLADRQIKKETGYPVSFFCTQHLPVSVRRITVIAFCRYSFFRLQADTFDSQTDFR